MHYSSLDCAYQVYMQDFIKNSYPDKLDFNYQIDDRDEMFKAVVRGYDYVGDAYLAYMQSGWRMLNVVRQIADFAFSGLPNVRSFLEFACGYGRFTRHLMMEYPVAHTIVSDIYREAVDWQNRQFGVCGIYSTSLPDEFPLAASFDMIFVGSLFSHLPEKLFEQWLKKLFNMLNPGGVIVLSVHDCHLIPGAQPKSMVSKDQFFLYEKNSESGTLSGEIYGTTYVSEEYVSRLIRKVCPESGGIYRRFVKGLYENQDVYIIPRDTNHDWSRFDLVITPIGGKWFCESKGNEIFGSAWALDLNPKGHFNFADIYINDVHIKTIPTIIEASGIIERYFPGLQTHPVRCDFRLPKFEIPVGSVLKCRFSANPNCYFDVYMNHFDTE